MKSLKGVIVFIFMVSGFACQHKSSHVLIPDFDDVKSSNNDIYHLSTLVDSIKIVQLQTSNACILGSIKKIVKRDSKYFIQTAEEEVAVFDDQGNFLMKIAKKGKGPGEYVRIDDFAVSDNGEFVALCSLKSIYFYTVSDGGFLKSINFDFFINSLICLPNKELLVQTTQSDFLIAHIDANGNTVNAFGSMNLSMELDQAFEFVRLDDSQYLYRVGETSDIYIYNIRNKTVSRSQFFEHKDALREQQLHEELLAQGNDPMAYINLRDYFNSHYRIRYFKMLKSKLLLSYLYDDKFYLLLYNSIDKAMTELVYRPHELSTLIDDMMYLPISHLYTMSRTDSDDNSIVTYIDALSLIKNYESDSSEVLTQSDMYEEILKLTKTVDINDNDILIEYFFNE